MPVLSIFSMVTLSVMVVLSGIAVRSFLIQKWHLELAQTSPYPPDETISHPFGY